MPRSLWFNCWRITENKSFVVSTAIPRFIPPPLPPALAPPQHINASNGNNKLPQWQSLGVHRDRVSSSSSSLYSVCTRFGQQRHDSQSDDFDLEEIPRNPRLFLAIHSIGDNATPSTSSSSVISFNVVCERENPMIGHSKEVEEVSTGSNRIYATHHVTSNNNNHRVSGGVRMVSFVVNQLLGWLCSLALHSAGDRRHLASRSSHYSELIVRGITAMIHVFQCGTRVVSIF